MSFSPLGNYLPILSSRKINQQAAVGLALEAGNKYIAEQNHVLATRVLLVSMKDGKVHALATSSPARQELLNLKKGLFLAIKTASGLDVSDLRITLRGTLAEDVQF